MKLLSLSTQQDGGNVLTKEHLLEHLRAYKLATTQTVETKGVKYDYVEVCDKVSEQSTECRVRELDSGVVGMRFEGVG